MIQNLYRKTGRVAYFFIRPLWLALNKRKWRVRVLLIDDEQVLLVVNWLSSQRWRLPGGGVRRGEDMIDTAKRELYEELRIDLKDDQLQLIGKVTMTDFGAPIKTAIFTAQIDPSSLERRQLEIVEAEWFKADDLPVNRDTVVDNAMALYRGIVDNPEHKT